MKKTSVQELVNRYNQLAEESASTWNSPTRLASSSKKKQKTDAPVYTPPKMEGNLYTGAFSRCFERNLKATAIATLAPMAAGAVVELAIGAGKGFFKKMKKSEKQISATEMAESWFVFGGDIYKTAEICEALLCGVPEKCEAEADYSRLKENVEGFLSTAAEELEDAVPAGIYAAFRELFYSAEGGRFMSRLRRDMVMWTKSTLPMAGQVKLCYDRYRREGYHSFPYGRMKECCAAQHSLELSRSFTLQDIIMLLVEAAKPETGTIDEELLVIVEQAFTSYADTVEAGNAGNNVTFVKQDFCLRNAIELSELNKILEGLLCFDIPSAEERKEESHQKNKKGFFGFRKKKPLTPEEPDGFSEAIQNNKELLHRVLDATEAPADTPTPTPAATTTATPTEAPTPVASEEAIDPHVVYEVETLLRNAKKCLKKVQNKKYLVLYDKVLLQLEEDLYKVDGISEDMIADTINSFCASQEKRRESVIAFNARPIK